MVPYCKSNLDLDGNQLSIGDILKVLLKVIPISMSVLFPDISPSNWIHCSKNKMASFTTSDYGSKINIQRQINEDQVRYLLDVIGK